MSKACWRVCFKKNWWFQFRDTISMAVPSARSLYAVKKNEKRKTIWLHTSAWRGFHGCVFTVTYYALWIWKYENTL